MDHAPQLRGVTPAGQPAYPRNLAGYQRLTGPVRWVETDDIRRHGITSDTYFEAGDKVSTLCGLEVAVVSVAAAGHDHCRYKECVDCYVAMGVELASTPEKPSARAAS